MPLDPNNTINDGSRDCGRFFIDVLGQYSRSQVTVNWDPQPRQVSEPLARQIDATWEQRMQRAVQCNSLLFDAPLCRLISVEAQKNRLALTMGPTTFKEFIGTNIAQPSLRYHYGEEVLANALGVSAAVTTSDGFLLLGRRSQRVINNCGKIHPIGGMVEPYADASRPPDVFDAILAELRNETCITAEMVSDITCLGLIRDKQIVQPELVLDVTLNVDAPSIRRLAQKAIEAQEHEDLVLLMNFQSSVVTFMEKHADVLTPVAIGALLLHGLRSWGSGWFASARGYLQTVI